MPPKPDKSEKSTDEIAIQMKEIQLSIDAITKLETFQNFLATQLPSVIRVQLASHTQFSPLKISLLPFDVPTHLAGCFKHISILILPKFPIPSA